MRVFTCVDHDCHYPVGVASVIVAENEQQARELLDAQLIEHGLNPYDEPPYTLQELALDTPQAIVLRDGDY